MLEPHRAIVVALKEEWDALLPKLDRAVRYQKARGALRAVTGELGREKVLLLWTGEGPERMSEALESICADVRVADFLLLGICGALSPDLRRGTIVAAGEVNAVGKEPIFPDALQLTEVVIRAEALPGWLWSEPKPLLSAEEKEVAWRKAGYPKAATVDLESYAFASFTKELGLPWMILRTVSDEKKETLPSFLEHAIGANGSIDRQKILKYAASRPWIWPHLLKMRRRVRKCMSRLGDALFRLFTREPSDSRFELRRSRW